MGNQQDYNLNQNQIQVLLTGTFGDGNIVKTNSNNWYYQTNSIHKSYLQYKGLLLGNLYNGNINSRINQGYKKDFIHTIHTTYSSEITKLHSLDLENKLILMNDLGLALCFMMMVLYIKGINSTT